MPRDLIPFSTDSVSALAKSLRTQLAARGAPPSHLELLNMLARATGHRNYQHLRAEASSGSFSDHQERAHPVDFDEALVARAANYFDAAGRLKQWPARTKVQNLCLWGIWAGIEAERIYEERAVNAALDALHLFGDAAILRRTLCALKLMTRTTDGRTYRRVERAPPADAAALIRRIGRRPRTAAKEVPLLA